MMMLSRLICTILLLLAALSIGISAHAQTSTKTSQVLVVEVASDDSKLNRVQLQFSQSVSLAQVYAKLREQGYSLDQIDWSRMRLVNAEQQASVEQQRKQLLNQLYAYYGLLRQQGSKQADLVRRVAEQVAQWPLIGALPIGAEQLGLIEANTYNNPQRLSERFAVSEQQSLYQAYSNPILQAGSANTSGRYQLILPTLASTRSRHPVLGALWVPFQLRYQPDLSVYAQMRQQNLASRIDPLADSEQIAEIKLNGEQQLHPLLSISQQGKPLSYGSLLVVLFKKTELPTEYKHINQALTDLAMYFSPLADWQGIGPTDTIATDQQPLLDDETKPVSWFEGVTERKQGWRPSTSDFGNVGLMQTPTARMSAPGEFNFTYYDSDEYRRMALNLQLFPWLETTIRYNDIRTRRYSQFEGFSGDQTLKDRGIDVKLRLWQESKWLPEISAGIRDAAGTGLFSGEYIVASKNFGQLDISAGMGWGYLGKNANATNPLCEIKDSFCVRPGGTSGRGGLFETGKWFHGQSAWFGGVEYQFEQWPVRFKLEYDPNNYQNEIARVPIKQDSRFNIGLEYEFDQVVSAKVSFERGNTLMFGASFRSNFDVIDFPKIDQDINRPAINPSQITSEQIRYGKLQQQLMFKLEDALANEAGFRLDEVWLSEDGKLVTFIGNSFRYRNHKIMLQRVAQIAVSELPNEVQQLHLVEQTNTMLTAETEFDLNIVRRALSRFEPQLSLSDSYVRTEISPRADGDQQLFRTEHQLAWPKLSIKPFLEQSFGGPEDFYMYNIGLDANATFALSPNSFISGTLATSLVNNYDEFNFLRSPSNLPPVRTRVREYVASSDIWLRDLVGVYQQQLSKNIYAQVHAGYFELMFAGVGTEFLYRPLDQDWSIGFDINYAKQRDPYDRLGLIDYDVWTGHASLYYQPRKWLPNSLVQLHVGQFLAGDRGAQLTFEHKFKSGIIAGAFAAKTNVSAQEFGEGSFNKGFFISIPFDLLQLRHSRGRGTIGWIPITRDGGQMLIREHRLIGFTDDRSRFYTD
ncbi:YjbH domain-containing protein [Pseudidiomarina taiwanensis]|uniref:YjbH domain-containing protein n=1 Tax=Pseudidiomarina taiwanensis TaxID=337250 RepID=A0A432ZKC4_9GAMM|nr:YjbH domain-containing protein [Pseudidiomarina taiwanensis]RUO78418.1 hypothetical protein CWI83_05165 [Pseudidiomarina taiwanensis]